MSCYDEPTTTRGRPQSQRGVKIGNRCHQQWRCESVSPVQRPSSRCTTCRGPSCSVSAARGPTSHPAPSGGESSEPPPYSPEITANTHTHTHKLLLEPDDTGLLLIFQRRKMRSYIISRCSFNIKHFWWGSFWFWLLKIVTGINNMNLSILAKTLAGTPRPLNLHSSHPALIDSTVQKVNTHTHTCQQYNLNVLPTVERLLSVKNLNWILTSAFMDV